MKNNLKLYRTKSGYTQEDISKKIGVSRQTINSIENNRFHPSILLCLKLSKELDCRLDDLFFLESWCGKVTGSYIFEHSRKLHHCGMSMIGGI